jgi:hypothetical protein
MVDGEFLERRHKRMIDRYAEDVLRLMAQVARVIKPGGRAILVVWNSCIKDTFVKNSEGIVRAGQLVGLRLSRRAERDLPERSRYLPMSGRSLSKRMRTETVLTFQRR